MIEKYFQKNRKRRRIFYFDKLYFVKYIENFFLIGKKNFSEGMCYIYNVNKFNI